MRTHIATTSEVYAALRACAPDAAPFSSEGSEQCRANRRPDRSRSHRHHGCRAPIVDDGAVVVTRRRIVAVGPWHEIDRALPRRARAGATRRHRHAGLHRHAYPLHAMLRALADHRRIADDPAHLQSGAAFAFARTGDGDGPAPFGAAAALGRHDHVRGHALSRP